MLLISSNAFVENRRRGERERINLYLIRCHWTSGKFRECHRLVKRNEGDRLAHLRLVYIARRRHSIDDEEHLFG